jgi:hypothetical protein
LPGRDDGLCEQDVDCASTVLSDFQQNKEIADSLDLILSAWVLTLHFFFRCGRITVLFVNGGKKHKLTVAVPDTMS